jgi:acetyl-CoA carboxylase carboxyltransferase component
LVAEYAERHLQPAVAARDGYIDELIEPVETRVRLAGALRSLSGPSRSFRDAW